MIAVSSAHRRESLEAVQYGIDTLKATVPIWKKVFIRETFCWIHHGYKHTKCVITNTNHDMIDS